MPIPPGARLGPYRILEPVGAGGMGEVYRARHEKLRRHVAIKVLPGEWSADPDRRARFEREARTASALNHPSIVTIHDIAEHEGTTYIAMELVDGRTLRDIIADGPLPVDDTLRIAVQLADALGRAHGAGILHRDIKPANVMVTAEGLAKVLDFGIARPIAVPDGPIERGAAPPGATGAGATAATQEGALVGTPRYMAPEQLLGGPVDHRADQFALGALLFEMLAGRPAFDASSERAVVAAILGSPPPPLRGIRADVPADLERAVARCLERRPEARHATTAELHTVLRQCEDRRVRARYGLRALLRRTEVRAALALAVAASAVAGALWVRGAERRWAEREAPAEIVRLVDDGDLYAAYRTGLLAARHRPADAAIQQAIERFTLPVSVTTEPAGAEVRVRGYGSPDAGWDRLGVTPLDVRIPHTLMRWRITHDGYEPFEGAPFSGPALLALAEGLVLDPVGVRPAGTVRVPGGPPGPPPGVRRAATEATQTVETFFLDRFEVTNRAYGDFIASGGYRRRELWPEPFLRDGRTVAWEDAIDAFRDATGHTGPATWTDGAHPPGEDDHPVGGISWYEAAAYCASVGGRLPSLYHWFRALGQEQISDILLHSNMAGEGPAPVGRFRGLGAYGTYDMAGNVKEWVWNAAPEGRFILGGAWNEPAYMFRFPAAHDAWTREATFGVRCAYFAEPPAEALFEPVVPERAYVVPEPVGDDAFEVLRGVFAYDATPLDARPVRSDDAMPRYRRETVSIRTAYDDERMDVHLLIPRDVAPPWQAVIWFPGGDVALLRSSETFSSQYLCDFIPDGGRVLIQPVYKGMYERFEPRQATPAARRDLIIRHAQDLSRTLDYLETREDIDARRVAYYGFSSGANLGPVFTAVEPRFAASILLAGGVTPAEFRPESHPLVYAPRVRTPTLMINGIDDFMFPYELSQRPLFDMLGPPAGAKRHARLAGGHIPTSRAGILREVGDWLDQHLGPVERVGPVRRVADRS